MSGTTKQDRRRWRDPALGPARLLELADGRRVAYHESGSGPTIVFLHGILVNTNLWRKLVPLLAREFRCVTFDLPIGAHNLPLVPGTPNGPLDVADLVADALAALDLDEVTLVGNDSGGLLCQLLVTRRPERIGRLVLTSCDYRDDFPPKLFSYLLLAGAVPGALWALVQPMRLRVVRRTPLAFGWLVNEPIEPAAEDSYLLPAIVDPAVRADLRAFIRGATKALSNEAADRLGHFDRPALIAWSADDRVFSPEIADRLAADLPNSRLAPIAGARTFSMEDQPGRLAETIRSFLREPAAA